MDEILKFNRDSDPEDRATIGAESQHAAPPDSPDGERAGGWRSKQAGDGEAQPVSPTEAPNAKKSGWWSKGWVAALLVGLSKFKFLLAALKFGKVFTTAGTMLFSILAYALIAPLSFAIGFVLLIFVHELGHLVVLMRYGLKVSAPVFIPFMGAMIGMKEMPKNVEMEATSAYAGPFAGTLAAFACYYTFLANGEQLYLQLAHVGFFLNLFNLIPLTPLDGGRIAGAISRWLWPVGWLGVLWWFLVGNHHPILLIILVLGGVQAYKAVFQKSSGDEEAYYQISVVTRGTLGVAYFLLVGILVYMSLYTNELIQTLFPR